MLKTTVRWKISADHPVLSLIAFFFIWKAILAAVVLASPSRGYDTSTDLLRSTHGNSHSTKAFKAPLDKFVRWDAIYFTQISHRGILFEQEWAFGWGFTKLLIFVARVFSQFQELGSLDAEPLAGIFLAHSFHLLSTIVLYQFSLDICQVKLKADRSRFSLLVAYLHIISPAGVFLSAPYSESPFCFFNFLGFYLHFKGLYGSQDRPIQRDFFLLSSGLVFGLATTLRSNGLLSGSLFLFELFRPLSKFHSSATTSKRLRHLGITILAGTVMACCAVLPQFIAFLEFCITINENQSKRPWCLSRIPSVYAWVQTHYWHVGFLSYWTVTNLPLFILAAPMLCVMSFSALEPWIRDDSKNFQNSKKPSRNPTKDFRAKAKIDQGTLQRLLAPQVILTVLALTSYHVQIITRLSSGYPNWYWWLASKISDNSELEWGGRKWNTGKVITRWMILYGLIQGGLFSSFLPPA